MWHDGFGYWGFTFFPLMWIGFWLFVVFFVFRGRRFGHHMYHTHDQSAEEILKERFAKGEIDEKEFKERLVVLTEHSTKK